MELKSYFTQCEDMLPRSRTELRRTALALRRNGVDTMEELCRLQEHELKKLAEFRGVGAKTLFVIEQVCAVYKEKINF